MTVRAALRRGTAAGVLLLLLGAAACSSSAPVRTGSVAASTAVQMTSPTGQRELLLRPNGDVAGLVVFMHGVDGDRDQIMGASFSPVRDALLADHLAVVASDAHGNNMGDPASVEDQVAAVDDARARLGVVPRVDILAFSMGGLDALLTASSHRVAGLRTVALLSPVVDQQPFVSGRFGPVIARAFGHPTSAQVPEILRRSDPLAQPVQNYRGYDYRFWHSPHDTTVPVAQSIVMSRMLAGAGIDTAVTPLTGNHGDLTALKPQDVVALFARTTT